MTAESTPPDRARVVELFDRVVDLPAEDARRILDAECAGAPEIRREVLELLAFDADRERSARPLGEATTRPDPGARREAAGPAAPAEPATVGRFRVTGRLGAGGMGVVYEGVDPTLGRAVALKLVLAGGGEEGRVRLLREAQAMARVAHPNVVPVYEVGYHEDGVFVAMELVPGQTLGAWAKAEARPWREALRLLVQAGRGLAAAHDAGVLHRDFKLENVLVGADGRARVLDFGLARAVDLPAEAPAAAGAEGGALDEALTAAGAIMGTPAYMSPEHFAGAVEPASDQWSFAVSAWRLLYGELPYRGNLLAIRAQVLEGPPPALARAEELPAAVVQAIQRGLARAPEDRFPSVAAMVDALESVLAVDPEADASVSRTQRRRAAVAITALGAVNLLGAGVRTGFRYDIGLPGVIVQGAVGLVVCVAIIGLLRRSLLRTRYNRRIMAFVVVLLGGHLAHRLYALARDLSVVDTLRTDAIFTVALAGLAAFTIERWIGWIAALALGYLAITLASAWAAVPGFGVLLVAAIGLGIHFWREPRRDSGEGAGSSGSSQSGSGRRSG